jgi:N-acetylneuraminic acid mutarotase
MAWLRLLALALLPIGWVQVLPAQTTSPISWTTAAPQPYRCHEAQGTVVNGKFYFFGGFDALKQPNHWVPTNRAYVYNPATNAWTAIAPMPRMNGTPYGGFTHAGCATDGTDIYFAGGYTSNMAGTGQIFASREVWKYSVAANGYSRLPDLPAARGSGQLEYLNGRLHFIAGANASRMDVSTHYVLSLANPAASWSTLAPLPNARNHAGSAVLNGKIYYVGGQHGHDDNSTKTDVHVYNPATNGWTQLRSLPGPRSHISESTFGYNGRVFVIGGSSSASTSLKDVLAYDPATDQWYPYTGLPTTRVSGVAAAIGNTLYYTTGSFSSTTYKGTLPAGTCSPISTLPCPRTKVSLPVSLPFTAAAGGLADRNGAGTGFTMADNPSARLAVDGTPAYPSVPGYEPSKLALSNGRLQITTNKGLAYLKPSLSSETNSQLNALGVGFLPGGRFTVEVTLINPYSSAKTTAYFEQGGLWFGLNEDNYVKLAVVALENGKHQVELRKEVNAASGGTDGALRTGLYLGSKSVKLVLEADPATGTVRGRYSVNGGTAVTVGTLSLPPGFFTGKVLADNATRAAFAGVYASHRRASMPVTFTFDDFRITPVASSTTAAADTAEAGHTDWAMAAHGESHATRAVLAPNPAGNVLFLTFPEPAGQITGMVITDATGRSRLVNAHRPAAENQIRIDVSGLKAGLYLLRIEADGGRQLLRFVKQ